MNFTPGSPDARLFTRRGGVPDQIIGIGDGLRIPRVMVDYTNLADRLVHTPGRSCAYPLICPASGGSIVARHRVAKEVITDADPWDRYEHRYRSARSDLRGSGWLGFAEHTVTRTLTGAVTVTTFDNTTKRAVSTDENSSAVVYPYAGVPKSVIIRNPDQSGSDSRRHLRRIMHRNVMRQYGDGSFFVEPQRTTETEAETGYQGSTWRTLKRVTTTNTYDGFGNTVLVETATDGGRRLTEDTDYSNDTAAWLIGRPTRELVRSCTAAGVCTTRESTYDYDDRGNPTVMTVEPNKPDLTLTSTTVFGRFGVVTSITMADDAGHSRADTYEYDNADQLYPTGIVNSRGHRTLVDTHPGLGVPLRTTDPNGVSITMRYDWFGRPRETNTPAVSRDLAGGVTGTRHGHRVIIVRCVDI